MESHKINAALDAVEAASKEDCSICMDEKMDNSVSRDSPERESDEFGSPRTACGIPSGYDVEEESGSDQESPENGPVLITIRTNVPKTVLHQPPVFTDCQLGL